MSEGGNRKKRKIALEVDIEDTEDCMVQDRCTQCNTYKLSNSGMGPGPISRSRHRLDTSVRSLGLGSYR